MRAELFLNGSIDHTSNRAVWQTPGQLALDMGAVGMRFDCAIGAQLDDPASVGSPNAFVRANIDRAAVLGLKLSLLLTMNAVRSAAWDAVGGNWNGFVPNATDWRVQRVPNDPAVNAAIASYAHSIIVYAKQVLGEENVQVEIGNEPRHVYRSGGSPSTTLSSDASAATTLSVASSTGFSVLGGKTAGYVIIETTPRQYVKYVSSPTGSSITVLTAVTAPSGTVVRVGDAYDNDGSVDTDFLAQLSYLASSVRASHPNIRMWNHTFWELGLDSTSGIHTYIDNFAALSPVTYPGFELFDGFAFNLYPVMPAGRLDIESWVQKAVTQAIDCIAYARTKSAFGLNTKPFAIQETGATSYELRTGNTGVVHSERMKGKAVMALLDALRNLSPDIDRVALYNARSGSESGSIGPNAYEVIDANGKVSVALLEMCRTRTLDATAPSGYVNEGQAYLGAQAGIAPF